jgi:putative aminopeptidase FrvX
MGCRRQKKIPLTVGKGPDGRLVAFRMFEELILTPLRNSVPKIGFFSFTGTDTDAFNSNVAAGFDILALRYMHTTVEMVHRDDVENVIKLI